MFGSGQKVVLLLKELKCERAWQPEFLFPAPMQRNWSWQHVTGILILERLREKNPILSIQWAIVSVRDSSSKNKGVQVIKKDLDFIFIFYMHSTKTHSLNTLKIHTNMDYSFHSSPHLLPYIMWSIHIYFWHLVKNKNVYTMFMWLARSFICVVIWLIWLFQCTHAVSSRRMNWFHTLAVKFINIFISIFLLYLNIYLQLILLVWVKKLNC